MCKNKKTEQESEDFNIKFYYSNTEKGSLAYALSYNGNNKKSQIRKIEGTFSNMLNSFFSDKTAKVIFPDGEKLELYAKDILLKVSELKINSSAMSA
ncbi:MAG: hypothetical protein N4A44_00795 [Alphaproteobacteria bacterium]|jgi:hypothetical protein|nr:hypothetical protein [Alphaproteobacteria bacterium]